MRESFRESNRHAADHIPVKLRALGYCDEAVAGRAPAKFGGKLFTPFSEEQVELLAEMEHRRYCAERWLDGWEVGENNPDRKTNPTLVAWENLPDAEKNKDREQVRAIPRLLLAVGRAIYCRPAP